jgi:hypothetical protein
MKDEWVVCRVFDKTTRVKKAYALPSYNLDVTSQDFAYVKMREFSKNLKLFV